MNIVAVQSDLQKEHHYPTNSTSIVVRLQLERSRIVFEIENECNTYGRWFKFFPVHPKQDTIPRVEKKSMKFEIAPPYFFPPIMGLIKYVSQVQPILNLEPSEEIDHCVKIKSKIHFYHFKRHLPHSRGQ